MSLVRRRFSRWLESDDSAKEDFLHEINGGAIEREALERMNRGCGTSHTVGDIRRWLREDPDFSKALRVARSEPPSTPMCWDLSKYADGSTPALPPPGSSDAEIEAAGFRVVR
jgi:hypothetical protein